MNADSSEAVVEVERTVANFGRKAALDDVSLSVPRGVVFGLVGENGAGKTTLIKHLLGLLKAQTGTVRVFGLDPVREPVRVLSRLGYLSEDRDLPDWMRLRRAVALLAGLLSDLGRRVRRRASPAVRSRPRRPHQDAFAGSAGTRAGCWRRWRFGPSSWFSTNPRPGSTRSCGERSFRRSSARSPRRAARSSSRRTCSTRSSGFRTTSR